MKRNYLYTKRFIFIALVMVLSLMFSIVAFATDVPKIKVDKGLTQPVFDSKAVITEEVWIESPTDSDKDGKRDLLYVLIRRPKATSEGLKVPVIAMLSPYFETDWDTALEQFQNVDHDYVGTDNPDTSDIKYDSLKYKGHTYQELVKANFAPDWLPAPRVSAGQSHDGIPVSDDVWGFTENKEQGITAYEESNDWRNYFICRGYAAVNVHMLGNYRSEGILTDGGYDENVAAAAVVDWLNGRVKAYTNPTDNIEVKAYWTTGDVAMSGLSYEGSLPLGAASTGVEGLKTIIPLAPVYNYYDYYRANGMVYAPSGYQGEDSCVMTAYCTTRMMDGSPTAPNEIVLNTYAQTLEYIKKAIDRKTGDYNTFWDERNLAAYAENIDCSILMVHGYSDLNVQFKQTAMIWEACERYNIPHKAIFHMSDHSTPVSYDGLDMFGKLHKWLDYWLYDIDNGVMESMPNITLQNNNTLEWEEYDSWPLNDNKFTRYYFANTDKNPGILTSTSHPQAFVDFSDKFMLELNRKELDGDKQMLPEEYERWRKHIICGSENAVKPDMTKQLDDRLLFLGEPLPANTRLSGTIKVTARVKSDQNVGALSAMVVDYGDLYRCTTDVAPTDSVVDFGDGLGKVNMVKLIQEQKTSPYQIVSRGSVDVQNPNPSGKIWLDVPEDNYIPSYYYRTAKIDTNKYYDYTWELTVTDYEFLADHQIGIIIYGSDPEFTTRPYKPTKFNIELGEGSYIDLPLVEVNPFDDIPTDAWYRSDVLSAYQQGLINGKSANNFAPQDNITLAEVIKLSACMHQIKTVGKLIPMPNDTVWYTPYVNYALENKLIPAAYGNYETPASRSQVAEIFAAALPKENYAPINTIDDDKISDVKLSDSYGSAVYLLYRAGILTGSDLPVSHNFLPASNIQRSEIAVIINRMMNENSRKTFTL